MVLFLRGERERNRMVLFFGEKNKTEDGHGHVLCWLDDVTSVTWMMTDRLSTKHDEYTIVQYCMYYLKTNYVSFRHKQTCASAYTLPPADQPWKLTLMLSCLATSHEKLNEQLIHLPRTRENVHTSPSWRIIAPAIAKGRISSSGGGEGWKPKIVRFGNESDWPTVH